MGITPKQFEELQARAAGRASRVRGRAAAPRAPRQASKPSSVLGIDPSLRGTGYGIIRLEGASPRAVTFGTIKAPRTWPQSRCLAQIALRVRDLVREHQPSVCVMEGLFFAQNLKTALLMGEARGAALAAVAETGLDIFEIAPRKMKLAIVGYGAAQKDAVARMVQRMLGLETPPEPDAADALALALALAQSSTRPGLRAPRLL